MLRLFGEQEELLDCFPPLFRPSKREPALALL